MMSNWVKMSSFQHSLTFTDVVSPMVKLARMVAPEPMDAPFLTTVGSTFQSFSVRKVPSGFVARGYVSLMKVTS